MYCDINKRVSKLFTSSQKIKDSSDEYNKRGVLLGDFINNNNEGKNVCSF